MKIPVSLPTNSSTCNQQRKEEKEEKIIKRPNAAAIKTTHTSPAL